MAKTPVWAPLALVCSLVANALLLAFYSADDSAQGVALQSRREGVAPPARETQLTFLPNNYRFMENTIKRFLYSPAAKVLPPAPSSSRNQQLHDSPVDSRSGAFFDPSLQAFVNPALLTNLRSMNKLQGSVNARKWEALREADPQLSSPTTAGGKRVDPAPLVGLRSGLFQWGTKNPVTGTPRVDCADSVADASSNGADARRFLGHVKCAQEPCNAGTVFTVECPPGCARRGGEILGGGTRKNPFMDLSSICKAAIVSGLAGHGDAPSLVSFEVVEPASSYAGVTHSGITTLDYTPGKSLAAARSHGYGSRAFVVLREGLDGELQAQNAAQDDDEGATKGKQEQARVLNISESVSKLAFEESEYAKTVPSQSNHVLQCQGGHAAARDLGGAFAQLNGTRALTVEVWVRDTSMNDETGYLSTGGSWTAGWGHQSTDYGFSLGMHKGQFGFGIAAQETGVWDWVVAPDWISMPQKGVWTHLAGTFDGETMLLYINGMEVGCGSRGARRAGVASDSRRGSHGEARSPHDGGSTR